MELSLERFFAMCSTSSNSFERSVDILFGKKPLSRIEKFNLSTPMMIYFVVTNNGKLCFEIMKDNFFVILGNQLFDPKYLKNADIS